MNKKYTFAFVLILIIASVYFSMDKPVEKELVVVPKKQSPQRKIASIKLKKPLNIKDIDLSRTPQSEHQARPRNRIRNLVVEKARSRDVVPPPTTSAFYRGLGSYKVASTLRSIKNDDYSPEMGVVQKLERGMTFFQPTPGRMDDNWAHVAYDPANNRYYPISSVLKVQGVDGNARDNLGQAGFQEYYYSQPGSVLYISSSHQRLFEDFQKLESQGYKVSIEVMRGQHRSR